jgi:hypothetical protein
MQELMSSEMYFDVCIARSLFATHPALIASKMSGNYSTSHSPFLFEVFVRCLLAGCMRVLKEF